jgi:outer membrane protein assembly factor BamB
MADVVRDGQNGVIHALDASSGQLMWKRDVGGRVEGSSDTVGGVIRSIGVAHDVLYVGTQKGTLCAYRPVM